jgi:dihydrolipoamide dehydrogenase
VVVAESQFDLIVIGAGPGGYVAAIRAAQLGMKTAIIDKQYLGGTCLNVGCIPSKALLDSTHKLHEAQHQLAAHGINTGGVSVDLAKMLTRKDAVVKKMVGGVSFLMKKNKIEYFPGAARVTGPGMLEVKGAEGTKSLTAKRLLIATGSEPVRIPSLPFDGKKIISSTEGLTIPVAPKRMIVVGAGAIGLELGSVWNRLGTEVVVLEFMDRILPGMDREMTTLFQRTLEKQGLKFFLNTKAEGAKIVGDKVQVTRVTGEEKVVEECDIVLVAVGRKPHTTGLGLEQVGVQIDQRGFVRVNPHTYETTVPGIYAIGDVIGGLMLAHKAEEEGVACVELLAGKAGHVNYRACPNVVYTSPELAQVGLTEDDARKERGEINVGKFQFMANGRAVAMGEGEGLIKIIGDAKTDRLLGVHILGPHASDLIAEAVVAMEFASSVEDLARSFHAHPTLPEAMKEAALAVEKRAIHM